MSRFRYRLLAGLALICFAGFAASAKPNFTGEWKMNASKSDFGQFPPPSSMTIKVTHDEPAFKMATKIASDNGDFDFESTHTTDGKESTNQFGPNPMKSVVKWQGDTLEIVTKGSFGDAEVTINDKFELSADGKTLTLKRHWASTQGEMDQKIVLEKQ